MNKVLMLSATALLTASGASAANATSVHLGGCDLTLHNSQKDVYAVQYSSCGSSGLSYGQGIVRKTKKGKFIDLSDNYSSSPSMSISFDLSYPFKKRGKWTEWMEISGTTSFEVNSGQYTVDGVPNNGRNVKAETLALLQRFKAERQH